MNKLEALRAKRDRERKNLERQKELCEATSLVIELLDEEIEKGEKDAKSAPNTPKKE